MSSGGIRQKLLLLTLGPAAALLVLIFGYFSYQDNLLLRSAMVERGITVARYLAAAAEFGVVTGNLEQLEAISARIVQGEVRALRIYDLDDRRILAYGELGEMPVPYRGPRGEADLCAEGEGLLLFCAPIAVTSLPVSDFQSETPDLTEDLPVGRLEVALSTETFMQKRSEGIWRSAWLAFAVLAVALLLTRRVERQIARPVLALTKTVENVGRGILESGLGEDASGELLTLQQGVNAMIEALAAYRDEMEAQVAGATVRLREALETLEQKNRDLEVQRQRAEMASMAKSQFLATMSHEIRTPLSGMIGMLSLLDKESLDESQHDNVQNLLEAASALRMLIDEILDFSRIEAGKLSIVSQAFAPAGVLDDVAVMLAPSAHYKELELFLDLDPELPEKVSGDPLRFRQVLINLMANAIKFTDQGHVLLRVRREQPAAEEEVSLVFEVIDTGIGIAREKLELVFDSFTQIDGSTTRRYGGSGLGTTISRELIKLMGGAIGVDSEPGKGSRFWFTLTWPVVEKARPKKQLLAGKHVLVLEPHPLGRDCLAAILGMLGATVVAVDSEQALLQAIERDAFDEIVLCENSSEFARQELAEQLKAREWGAKTPRLCHLTFINGHSATRLFDCHVSKPLSASRLAALLSRRQSEAGTTTQTTCRPLKLLLAEDNAINAKVMLHMLKGAGHEVIHVNNGQEALDAMRHAQLDGVLMDVRMPEMDGLTATRRWREEEQTSGGHLPIIALTANDSREDRQACLSAGMDDFLVKPVDSTQVSVVLERYC
jgi:two-component system sensor histidine kinase BarA